MTDASRHARAAVLLRQHAETTRLLGVDCLPVSMSVPAGALPDIDPRSNGSAGALVANAGVQQTLDALRERHANESPILDAISGWTNIVFGAGDPKAQLMFVGEAPGADEDAQGEPFVGRAGQMLDKWIGAMGLRREVVYIANVLKVRPPNNRTPTPAEWAMDGPYLREQIAIIKPRAIVTLGKPAANYLLDTDASMGELRGSWAECRAGDLTVPVMPTYHPAYLLRAHTPENRKKVWSDLQQVMEKLGLG